MVISSKKICQHNQLKLRNNSIYDSRWLTKFINKFMQHGKKHIVEKHIYNAFATIKNILRINPNDILLKSIAVLKPYVGVAKFYTNKEYRKKRRRRAMLIPVPIKSHRQYILSLTWFVQLICNQKKIRHKHRHVNIRKITTKRGLSTSKKKLFKDRFHISLRGQELNNIINDKFIDIYKNKFIQIARHKTAFYVKLTNNRAYDSYRWI